ncbi:Molybdopterin synthase catalytic subunit [Cyphomyrmex costatus]|uniref:Molybdopterin synthase catalytic subunit n=1 Tax=Cyphomyrmex costatus TaxID=456900 RepID=A0A195CWA1_9HYME|nr:Molybdopterin synthase catalytic subunit [Cyphomyrmex costatus]
MDKNEIQATILFFAKARELVGCKECKLSIQKKLSFTDLFDKIVNTYELESIRNQLILAVNDEFVIPNSILVLSENDKIAVIPPLSGGLIMETLKNFVKLQQEELNIAEIMELVTFPNCGAISNFIGITRDNFENKKVIKLEYEAYESMALKEMTNICNKIRSQWDVEGIAIYHRIGEVPISKASVVIAVSSSHRKESLRAVEYAINMLKASVPIWKKEIYEIGEPQWKQNKECKWMNNINYYRLKFENVAKSTVVKVEEAQMASDINEKESNEDVIDPNLVQIQANSEELNRRIKSFISRKRQHVNTVNVQEFCRHSEENDNKNSCARVDAILIRRKDSRSHIKVHRVLNEWGPQTIDQSILRKSITNNTNFNVSGSFPILDDRISDTERMIGINKPVPKDIYERLKNIEDRILYIESISPEYKDFWM